MKLKHIALTAALTVAMTTLTSCGSGDPSFSLSSESTGFSQITVQQSKVDVLWVIDNSGSMQGAQDNLAANFTTFMSTLTTSNINYQIGVAGTNAYLGLPSMSSSVRYDTDKLHFRDGDGVNNSGVSVIDTNTIDPVSTFVTNASLGTTGAADERAFQSMQGSLNDSFNSGFKRSNSFLAVIILSDENDLSHDGVDTYKSGTHTLHSTASYKTYLDNLTGSTADTQNYSLSTISILNNDTNCLNEQKAAYSSSQTFGTRYEELVDSTSLDAAEAMSRKISICSDFGASLGTLAQDIIDDALITKFEIDRKPLVSTIKVTVNGSLVPMSNGSSDGWVYTEDSDKYFILFTTNNLVPADSSINIAFDPAQFDDN